MAALSKCRAFLSYVSRTEIYFTRPIFKPGNKREDKVAPLKDHLILKANGQAVNSSKNRTNEFDTSGPLVFVRFWEEIEDTKKTFQN